jgi:uncharacterized coiled-coil protein SlyX
MDHQPNKQTNRIDRLEESGAYADRHIEILSTEIAQLNRSLLELSRRFTHIEARLSELNNRVGEDPGNVPPPHSAGPDIPKDPL